MSCWRYGAKSWRRWKKLGIAPFGAAFETSGDIAQVRERFAQDANFRVAGRITAHRDMGKSHFVDLKDASGRIQIYLHAKELGPEAMGIFKLLDLGDLIGVEGTCFTTKTGEPTLKVHKLEVLAKSLRPLPEKWHGLQDIEARYRQRYLDLITNDQSARFCEAICHCSQIRLFWRVAALSKWKRRCCNRSRAGRRRNRLRPITRRSGWIFTCGSRRNFI